MRTSVPSAVRSVVKRLYVKTVVVIRIKPLGELGRLQWCKMRLQQLLVSVMEQFALKAATEMCRRLKHEETSHSEVCTKHKTSLMRN